MKAKRIEKKKNNEAKAERVAYLDIIRLDTSYLIYIVQDNSSLMEVRAHREDNKRSATFFLPLRCLMK